MLLLREILSIVAFVMCISACTPQAPIDPNIILGLEPDSGTNPDTGTETEDSGSPLANYDYTLGTPSTRAAAISGTLMSRLSGQNIASQDLTDEDFSVRPYQHPQTGQVYSSLDNAHRQLNGSDTARPIAALDTNAPDIWTNGWTGNGVSVGVVDFWPEGMAQIDDHGDYVSLIINSVAPEADIYMRNEAANDALARAAWQALDEIGVHITNNSWGYDKAERAPDGSYTGNIVARFENDVAQGIAAGQRIIGSYNYDEDALFIFAAGNGGGNCGDDYYVDVCNYHAAVTKGLRANGVEDGGALMWVGALNDAGTAMAGYSYHAGNLKNDFMVAHDDVLSPGDAAGTSFAAPRVAGAAALLKHKFPNLNGADLKHILLYTAEDMGEEGVDDVYGYGKLDLSNAMSPQNYLRPEDDVPSGEVPN